VAQYFASLGGGNCSGSVTTVIPTGAPTISVSVSQAATACTDPNNPFPFLKGSPYSGTAANYVAASDSVGDMQSYLLSQSQSLFGAGNTPTISVIGHLATDTSLYGTDVG